MKRFLLTLLAFFASAASASAVCTSPAVMHDFPGTSFNMSLATNAGDGNCISNVGLIGTLPAYAAIPAFKIDQTTPGATNLVAATQSGAWTVSQSGAWTVAITAAALPLPSGAATAALQPTNAASGSATSGQTGNLAFGAVTTGAPTYTTAQSNPLSLDTAGNLRVNVVAGGAGGGAVTIANGADTAQGTTTDAPATVPTTSTAATIISLLKALNNVANAPATFAGQYPSGAVAITASATGTTAATTATLAGTAGKTTYICGYSIRANATANANVTNTITGVVTATMSSIMWVPANTAGLGVDEQIFNPCIPASATNTAIAVVSGAPGTGGLVSSRGWGYQL